MGWCLSLRVTEYLKYDTCPLSCWETVALGLGASDKGGGEKAATRQGGQGAQIRAHSGALRAGESLRHAPKAKSKLGQEEACFSRLWVSQRDNTKHKYLDAKTEKVKE